MSTDIAVPTQSTVAEIDRMYAWADMAQKVSAMAKPLAATAAVPASMRGKPAEVTAAILAGVELGFPPMKALSAVDIIEGRLTMTAIAMRAVALSHGHDVWVEESTMNRAVVCGIRKGSDRTQRSEWTIERAQRAGLTNKRNWQSNPTAMLIARATSEVCRWVAADALMAMPYSVEELRDLHDDEPAPTPEPTATVTMRRDPDLIPPADQNPAPDDLADATSWDGDDPERDAP